jgi:hypothetical protein
MIVLQYVRGLYNNCIMHWPSGLRIIDAVSWEQMFIPCQSVYEPVVYFLFFLSVQTRYIPVQDP